MAYSGCGTPSVGGDATVTAGDLFTTTWQYVEFAPTRLREELPGKGTANSVQLAELDASASPSTQQPC